MGDSGNFQRGSLGNGSAAKKLKCRRQFAGILPDHLLLFDAMRIIQEYRLSNPNDCRLTLMELKRRRYR